MTAGRGHGPVGTGVHLLRPAPGPSGGTTADAWLTILFVPVLPLGEWTLRAPDAPGPSLLVTRVTPPRALKSLAWMATGIAAVVLGLLPGYAAVTFFMGSKPVELGGLFSSAGAVVGALAWLDLTRERVPLAAAARVLRGARDPSREE